MTRRISALYWSPCGRTAAWVQAMAAGAAGAAQLPVFSADLTLPQARQQLRCFGPEDLVFFALPVYAGRVPNRLLPFLRGQLEGGGALAVPVTVFGNRSSGDSFRELALLLAQAGFQVIAGGICVAQHAFAPALAAGRPNRQDLAAAGDFGRQVWEKAQACPRTLELSSAPLSPYYQPTDRDGRPVSFLKAKPATHMARCTGCGLCAARCPENAIDPREPWRVPGVCIKCQACVQCCPQGAKFWDDPAFLAHQAALEQLFTQQKCGEFFL